MNLHSSAALLNIATEDLLSADAGVGEHCHLQLGKLQKQRHKSQIKEMAVGLQQSPGPVLGSTGQPSSLKGWMVFCSCCPFHWKRGIFPLVPGETL